MLELKKLTKYYINESQVVKALDRIDLTVEPGEFLVIYGESGSGKSTLLQILGGLDSYEDGDYAIDGMSTSGFDEVDYESFRREKLGFIFQDFLLIPSFTVYNNIVAVLAPLGLSKAEIKHRVKEVLEAVGLSKLAKSKASTLSGGEAQRVGIARALAKHPQIILADEPTGNLDATTAKEIIDLLGSISKDKMTIVVTHDPDAYDHIATRKIKLSDGAIIEEVQLKKRNNQSNDSALEKEPVKAGGAYQLSKLNFVSSPKRILIQIAIFIFLFMTLTLGFGSLALKMSHRNMVIVTSFSNPDETRVIVLHEDHSLFTDGELNELSLNPDVEAVFPYDKLFDVTVLCGDNMNEGVVRSARNLSAFWLSSGRLPESRYEIVVGYDRNLKVGDTLQISFGSDQNYKQAFEIVGLSMDDPYENKIEIYFSDPFFTEHGLMIPDQSTGSLVYAEDMMLTNNYIGVDDSLDDNQLLIDWTRYSELCANASISGCELNPDADFDSISWVDVDFYTIHPFFSEIQETTISVKPFEAFGVYNVKGNQDTLEHLFALDPYQITLSVSNEQAAKRLMSSLDSDEYIVFYPYENIDSYFTDEGSTNFYTSLLWFVGISITAIILSWISLRNIVSLRNRDMTILRAFGFPSKKLYASLIMEYALLAIIASIIVWLAIWVDNWKIHLGIPNYLILFNAWNYILLLVISLAVVFVMTNRTIQEGLKYGIAKSLKGGVKG